jgi:hypothetical protein
VVSIFDLSVEDIIVFWILAGTADMVTFTILYKVMFRRWWWHRAQAYDVWWNEKGWGIEGTGNPFETLMKMIETIIESEENGRDNKDT